MKFKDFLEEKKVEEEMTGTAAVAGAGDDSSTVVVKKKKKKIPMNTLGTLELASESVELEEQSRGMAADAKAHEMGKKAARSGASYSDNPFDKGSSKHLAWSKGHNKARSSMKEDVEQIDELSSNTLRRYVDKAGYQSDNKRDPKAKKREEGEYQASMKIRGKAKVNATESADLEEARKMPKEWQAGYSHGVSGSDRDRRASAKYGPNAHHYDAGYAAGRKDKEKQYSPRGKHQPDMFEDKQLDEVSSNLLRRAADRAAKKGEEARQRGMTAAHGLQSTKAHGDEAEKRAKQRGKFSRASTDKMMKELGINEESPLQALKNKAGEIINKKNYEAALGHMKKTGKSAADAARMYKGVDARTLQKHYETQKESVDMDYEYNEQLDEAKMEPAKADPKAAARRKAIERAMERKKNKDNWYDDEPKSKTRKMGGSYGYGQYDESVELDENLEEAYTKQQIMKIRQILGRDGQANKKVGVEKLMKHGNWSKETAHSMHKAAMQESVELEEARILTKTASKEEEKAAQQGYKDGLKRVNRNPYQATEYKLKDAYTTGQMVARSKLKESVELEEAKFNKGDSVKIKNVKKYDALAKDDEGTVIGMMSGKVMVKVGSGQMNVDPKDLVLEATYGFSPVIAKGEKAKDYMAKKAQQRRDMNTKNDPGAAKKHLALSVLDKEKARAKAKKKGANPSEFEYATGAKPNKMTMVQKGLDPKKARTKKGLPEDVEQMMKAIKEEARKRLEEKDS